MLDDSLKRILECFGRVCINWFLILISPLLAWPLFAFAIFMQKKEAFKILVKGERFFWK